jgi:Tol biopolymer transport system component
LHSQFREGEAKLSPDGKWLAYTSAESKQLEVYVVSFPTPDAKFQLSTNGGRIPVWSRDGRELYFISGDSVTLGRVSHVAEARSHRGRIASQSVDEDAQRLSSLPA